MTRPFEGVKILDFTQVLAGPYASYQLALLGADVIKVERREGEDMRRTPLSREWAERGLAPGWQAINGNKRSLTLELALRLLESAAGARTTMQSPLRWSEDASWKLDYNNIAQMSPEELARRRAEFDKQKEIARGNRAA